MDASNSPSYPSSLSSTIRASFTRSYDTLAQTQPARESAVEVTSSVCAVLTTQPDDISSHTFLRSPLASFPSWRCDGPVCSSRKMILPEDTKAPIPSDDEFEYEDEYQYEEEYSPYDYDFDSSSPRETRPFVPYTDDPEPYPFNNTGADVNAASDHAGRGDELPYPASPRSTLTHPLLADVSDIELGLGLGLAPPYTPRDENPRSRAAVRAARTRAEEAKGKMSRRARLWRMAWRGVVVYLALMGVMTITWRMLGPGRRGPGWDGPHPPPPHSDDGSSGPGRPEQDGGKGSGGGGGGGWEDHEHDHRPDGVPLECISWDASSYSPFPIASSQPHLPAPLDPEVGSRRSTNRTILLPLDGRELFAHLVGSSAIGNFFLSTYDPSDSTTWKQDSEGAITPSEDEEVEIGQGKYLRVVVEAVYDVLPGLEGPADEETSPGWEALLASKVCLMSRNRTLVDSPSSSDSDPEPSSSSASLSRRNRKDGATPPFLLPGMGLNAYTRRPASSPHEWRNPLSFRIHVALRLAPPRAARVRRTPSPKQRAQPRPPWWRHGRVRRPRSRSSRQARDQLGIGGDRAGEDESGSDQHRRER
jgi:hypothetical protein